MSSRLQLDMRNLSLGRHHLVNAYEVEAGNGVIQGCRGYGDSHGDSHGYGYGMGMGIKIQSPLQPWCNCR